MAVVPLLEGTVDAMLAHHRHVNVRRQRGHMSVRDLNKLPTPMPRDLIAGLEQQHTTTLGELIQELKHSADGFQGNYRAFACDDVLDSIHRCALGLQASKADQRKEHGHGSGSRRPGEPLGGSRGKAYLQTCLRLVQATCTSCNINFSDPYSGRGNVQL